MGALRPLNAALLLIAAAAIAGPAWAVFVFEPSLAGTVPDASMLARFQAMADEACKCSRLNASEDGYGRCRAPYEQAVAPYQPGGMASACGPMSSAWTCFDEQCRASVVVERSGGACSAEEERIFAAVWEQAGGDTAEDGWERGLAAIARAREALERGEKVNVRPGSGTGGGGC